MSEKTDVEVVADALQKLIDLDIAAGEMMLADEAIPRSTAAVVACHSNVVEKYKALLPLISTRLSKIAELHLPIEAREWKFKFTEEVLALDIVGPRGYFVSTRNRRKELHTLSIEVAADAAQQPVPTATAVGGSEAPLVDPYADPTAYSPASVFIDPEHFPTLKAIRKALDANPSIRWRRPTGKNGKPIGNRLEIHAGDWLRFKEQGADLLDLPANIVDAVMETEKRKAEIRNPAGK